MDKWFIDKLNIDSLLQKEGMYQAPGVEVASSFKSEAHDELVELEEKSFWFKHRNEIIIEGVRSYPPKGNRVIEAGGGNGNCTYYLQKNGFETAMFEPGEGGCINAVSRGVKNVVCSLLNEKYVKEHSIESVGLFDVIEHIEDDRAFLKELQKILIDDGIIYITVPAHKLLWSSSDTGHFRRYSKKTLRDIVSDSGYTILYDTYFFWYLTFPIFMLRALPYILGGRKEGKATTLKKQEFIAPRFIMKIISVMNSIETRTIRRRRHMVVGGASLFLIAKKK